MRGYGEESAASTCGDHPLADVESQEGGAVEDNVHDGLEGVGREAFSGRDLATGNRERDKLFSNRN